MKEYTLSVGQSICGLVTRIQLAHEEDEDILLTFCNGEERTELGRTSVKDALDILRAAGMRELERLEAERTARRGRGSGPSGCAMGS